MWNFACKATSKTIQTKNNPVASTKASSVCSDDEVSLNQSREEGLECPICWESFNIVENVPYVLWCGHTLCKNCILGLQRAISRLPSLPIQLPFFVSCPWCNILSLRLVYKGNLKYPNKNFFLLWMLESMNGDRSKSCYTKEKPVVNPVSNRRDPCTYYSHQMELVEHNYGNVILRIPGFSNIARVRLCLRNLLLFSVRLVAKFPMMIIFILIVLYVIPTTAVILALYVICTVFFALPSLLVLYFAVRSLDWLVKKLVT